MFQSLSSTTPQDKEDLVTFNRYGCQLYKTILVIKRRIIILKSRDSSRALSSHRRILMVHLASVNCGDLDICSLLTSCLLQHPLLPPRGFSRSPPPCTPSAPPRSTLSLEVRFRF